MAIEQALEKLTAAVEANTAALEAIRATGSGKPSAAPPAGTPAEDKPKGKSGRPPKITPEMVSNAVRKFTDVPPDELEARKEEVREIFKHPKIGVARAGEIPPDKRQLFLDMLEKRATELAEEVDEADESGEDDDLV